MDATENDTGIAVTFDAFELDLIEELLQFKDSNVCHRQEEGERNLAAKVRRILDAQSQRGAGI
jgi:hypothetical protein